MRSDEVDGKGWWYDLKRGLDGHIGVRWLIGIFRK